MISRSGTLVALRLRMHAHQRPALPGRVRTFVGDQRGAVTVEYLLIFSFTLVVTAAIALSGEGFVRVGEDSEEILRSNTP